MMNTIIINLIKYILMHFKAMNNSKDKENKNIPSVKSILLIYKKK